MTLRARVLTAIRWTAAARFLGQLFSWAITLIVIRILAPADYGLMAMATVLLAFLYLVNDLGLDAVLVQKKDLDHATRRRIFGVVITGNLAIFALLQLGAPLIADFFREEALTLIVRILSLQFIFYIFESLPQCKLERELDFKRRSLVDLATLIIGSIATLILALLGYGVWSLVIGNLITIATRVIGLNIIAPCQVMPSFSWKGMKQNVLFGGYVAIDKMLWFIFAESDKFIGGRMLGKQLLGYYAVANHIAALPINKIAGLIRSVAFPAFSQVQSDTAAIRFYLQKAMRLMSIIVFPVFLGISCVAPELVSVVLGQKWLPAIVPLQILAVAMPLRMLSTVLPPVLWGVGKPRVSAGNYLVAAVLMPASFVVGARWGPVGLALAWISVYPFVFLVPVARTAAVLKSSSPGVLAPLLRPALAGAAMYAAVAGLRQILPASFGEIAVLLCLMFAGAVVYLSLIALLCRETCREAFSLVKG